MSNETDFHDELRFTLYRLRVVSALPDGHHKESILRAIEERLPAMAELPEGRYKDEVQRVIREGLDAARPAAPGEDDQDGRYKSAA